MSEELRLRIIYGSLFGVICLLSAWFGGWVYGLVLLFALYHAGEEWRTISNCATKFFTLGLVGLFAILMFAPLFFNFSLFKAMPHPWLENLPLERLNFTLFIGVLGATALAIVTNRDNKLKTSLIGALYLSLAFYALWYIRLGGDNGRWSLLALFVMIWAADSLAYFTGRTFGGPKLAPRISPNKTWSGLGGSMAGAAIAAGIFGYCYGSCLLGAVFIGAFVGLIGQIGDLFESAFKRSYGVKDSGTLIPGHGGILDRVDGLLAAALFSLILFTLCSSIDESPFLLNLCLCGK